MEQLWHRRLTEKRNYSLILASRFYQKLQNPFLQKKKKKEKIYTKLTFKAWCTFTLVVIHLVHTSPVVLAGFGGTFVDVQIAVVALEPWHAETLVHVHTVFADGPILTRLRVTFINVLIAVGPPVPGRTLAPVPSVQDVRASATVLTSLL